MVNPKAAIPQLINAITKKIKVCQNYATDRQTKPWNSFVESGAKELLEVLNEKQRNLETRWKNEFEAQLSNEEWERYSEDVEKAVDDIDKAQGDFRSGLSPNKVKMLPILELLKLKKVDELKIQPHVSLSLSNLRL